MRGGILSGVAFGCFIGLLVGLASSPVVGAVLGIISSIATAFLSRASASPKDAEEPGAQLCRFRFLSGFAFAGALAVCAGILLRSYHWLGPSPEAVRDRWIALGLRTNEAIAIALVRTEGLEFQEKDKALVARTSPFSPILFSDFTSGAAEEEELDPRNRRSDVTLRKWDRAENKVWPRLANALRGTKNLPEEQRTEVMVEIWKELTK